MSRNNKPHRLHIPAQMLHDAFRRAVGDTGNEDAAFHHVAEAAEALFGHTVVNHNEACDGPARLARIECLVERLLDLAQRDRILFAFITNQGGKPVVTLDPQHGFSDRKLGLEAFIGKAGAPDENGGPTVVPDPDRPLTVESSDASVGVEQGADAFHWFITTPADAGSATITIKGDSRVEPVQFVFDYVQPTLDRINVAFGGLVPDA